MDSLSDFHVFIDQIIEEKYGSGITDGERTQMRDELLKRLSQWILLKAMTEIGAKNPETLKRITTLTESDTTPETVVRLIKEEIPDMQTFLTQTLLSFKQAYLDA